MQILKNLSKEMPSLRVNIIFEQFLITFVSFIIFSVLLFVLFFFLTLFYLNLVLKIQKHHNLIMFCSNQNLQTISHFSFLTSVLILLIFVACFNYEFLLLFIILLLLLWSGFKLHHYKTIYKFDIILLFLIHAQYLFGVWRWTFVKNKILWLIS
jgi:hypothetical protein